MNSRPSIKVHPTTSDIDTFEKLVSEIEKLPFSGFQLLASFAIANRSRLLKESRRIFSTPAPDFQAL